MSKTVIWLLLLLGFILSALPVCWQWNNDVEEYRYEQYIAPYRQWEYENQQRRFEEWQKSHPDEQIWLNMEWLSNFDSSASFSPIYPFSNPLFPHIKATLLLLVACFWFFFLPNLLGLINYGFIPDIVFGASAIFYSSIGLLPWLFGLTILITVLIVSLMHIGWIK